MTTPAQPHDVLRRTAGVLAVTQLMSWGTLYYAFGVVSPASTSAGEWSATTTSAAYSLGVLASGVSAPAVATALTRVGPRRTMVAGSVVGGLGMVGWARATSVAHLVAAWALIGVAMAATLYEPAIATVIGHGGARSRRAIVVLTTGGGLASTLFGPLTHWLVEAFGWRAAVATLGVSTAGVTAVLHSMLPTSLPRKPPVRASNARRGRAPAWLRTGVVLEQVAHVATTVFLVSFLVDRGVASGTAAGALAAMGVGKLFGRLAIGAALGSVAANRVAAAATATQFVSLAALTVVDGLAFLLACAALTGAASGTSTVLRPLMTVEATGADTYPAIGARLQRDAVVGRSAAPVALGVAVGTAGWTTAWLAATVIFLVASVAFSRGPGSRRS